MIKKVAEAQHTTHSYGSFIISVYFDNETKQEHISLTKGNIRNNTEIFCRIASECITGMVLNSSDCDCNEQMTEAFRMIQKEDNGIIIFLRQEGRGLGLTTKIKGLANKNLGYDTFTAIELLGQKADIREYSVAIAILELEGVKSIRLATNNPDKLKALKKSNILLIERIPIIIQPTTRTEVHLKAKKKRGHLL